VANISFDEGGNPVQAVAVPDFDVNAYMFLDDIISGKVRTIDIIHKVQAAEAAAAVSGDISELIKFQDSGFITFDNTNPVIITIPQDPKVFIDGIMNPDPVVNNKDPMKPIVPTVVPTVPTVPTVLPALPTQVQTKDGIMTMPNNLSEKVDLILLLQLREGGLI